VRKLTRLLEGLGLATSLLGDKWKARAVPKVGRMARPRKVAPASYSDLRIYEFLIQWNLSDGVPVHFSDTGSGVRFRHNGLLHSAPGVAFLPYSWALRLNRSRLPFCG
jgi:hypothetical protein